MKTQQKDYKNTPEEEQHKKEEKVRNNQVIVFKLAGEEYALFIDQIKEVVPTPNIAKVPLTPSYVKGLANIRGNILSIIDLEDKFGMKVSKVESKKASYTLVVESKEYNMAVLVEDVPNTLSVADDEIDYSTSVIAEATNNGNYIKGIIKLEERLIILIDVFSIITKEDLAQNNASGVI
ncbi:chemotaxis protein CheW [Limibacter armeniacum]|uniref:chemotaxis protein CheW n=1 Tax=Limibacter armeniacum TaxID=466084 RepID=UPI002FE530ED